jgi:hypothetical protein
MDEYMNNKEFAKLDPARVYRHPHDILIDKTLTKPDKIDILQRWGYDERELSVAEEENMLSHNPYQGNILDEVNKCLLELGVDSTKENRPPTKQG